MPVNYHVRSSTWRMPCTPECIVHGIGIWNNCIRTFWIHFTLYPTNVCNIRIVCSKTCVPSTKATIGNQFSCNTHRSSCHTTERVCYCNAVLTCNIGINKRCICSGIPKVIGVARACRKNYETWISTIIASNRNRWWIYNCNREVCTKRSVQTSTYTAHTDISRCSCIAYGYSN